MCPDGVVAHHESLSSFRPGFESRSGRLIQVRNGEDLASPMPFSTFSPIDFSAIDSENADLGAYHQGVRARKHPSIDILRFNGYRKMLFR